MSSSRREVEAEGRRRILLPREKKNPSSTKEEELFFYERRRGIYFPGEVKRSNSPWRDEEVEFTLER